MCSLALRPLFEYRATGFHVNASAALSRTYLHDLRAGVIRHVFSDLTFIDDFREMVIRIRIELALILGGWRDWYRSSGGIRVGLVALQAIDIRVDAL